MAAAPSSANMRTQSLPPKSSGSPRLSPTASSFDPSDQMRTTASPTNSEETVAATRTVTPGAIKATPGSGAAVFSTQDGRYPHRLPPGPPFTPVIVRSNLVWGVVAYANYWRNKYPFYYHCFFTGAGWTITDLWDKADIHLECPSFLEEVLKFITRDNEFRAHRFATEWSTQHPGKLDMIGGDLTGIFDPHDCLGFVYKIFTDGETNDWPPEFLYQVLYIMRTAMRLTMEKQRDSENAAEGSATRKLPDDKSNRLRAAPSMAPSSTGVSLPPYAPVPRGPPYGGHVAIPPPPTHGQLRNPKNKAARPSSNSGSYQTLPQGQNWVTDYTRAGSDQRLRPPPARFIHGTQRLPSHVPMDPAPMGGFVHVSPLHQSSPFTSPPFPPAQLGFGPVLPHETMHNPPGPYDSRPPGAAYQSFGPPMVDPRSGIPLEELTNNIHHHANRNADGNSSTRRRGSVSNRSSLLFNPYGAERPDKANFTQVSTARKGGRGGLHNSMGRGRGYSNSTHRGSVSNIYDRDEAQPRVPSGMFAGNFAERAAFYNRNPDIVNDHEYGCDAHRIGPLNTTVKKLYVSNLPENATEQALLEKFRTRASAQNVVIKTAHGHTEATHAFVYFSSPAEARKCLPDQVRFEINNQQLVVSVPYVYYKSEASPSSRVSQPSGVPPRHHPSAQGPVDDLSQRNNSGPTQYSPQDARSDLPGNNRKYYQEATRNAGSPRKRENKSEKKVEDQVEDQVRNGNEHRVENKAENSGKFSLKKKKNKNQSRAQHVKEATSIDPSTAGKGGEKPKEGDAVANETSKELGTVLNSEEKDIGAEASGPAITSTSTTAAVPEVSTSDQNQQQDKPHDTIIQVDNIKHQEVVESKTNPSPVYSSVPEAPLVEAHSDPIGQDATVTEPEKPTDTEESDAIIFTPNTSEEVSFEENHGTEFVIPSTQETQEMQETAETLEAPIPAGEPQSSLGGRSSALSSVVSEAPKVEDSEAIIAPPEVKPEAPGAITPKAGENPSKPPTVEPAKKQGAKQTQSLYPFAKPKTQTKKEKQAKKKDKKKERKEKTKPEKAGPALKNSENLSASHANTATDGFKRAVDKAEEGRIEDIEVNARAKGKDHGDSHLAQEVDEEHQDQVESVGSEYQHHERILSNAQKFTAKKEFVAQIQEHEEARSGNSFCASGDTVPVQAASIPQGKVVAPIIEPPVSKPEQIKETPKKKTVRLPQIAVPRLNLTKLKRSAPDTFLPLLDTRSPPKNETPEASTPKLLTSQPIEQAHRPSDTDNTNGSPDVMSVASSATLRADSPPTIPDSTTTEFFTPLPTPASQNLSAEASVSTPTGQNTLPEAPAAPVSPAAVSAPKTKKKNKKKKKKVKATPSTTTQEGQPRPAEDAEEKEPFYKQMNEIADIIAQKNEEAHSDGGDSKKGQDGSSATAGGDEVKVCDATSTKTSSNPPSSPPPRSSA